MIPSSDIESILFSGSVDKDQLADLMSDYNDVFSFINYGDFGEIHWLNTSGPIYTTYTDNCGTGQVEAVNNVGGDEDYHEVIFRQPITKKELIETLSAAMFDPFGSYYFDGNENWNNKNIAVWWNKSEERVNYIIDRYKEELNLPDKPHVTSWKIGDEVFTGQLYGPPRPIPENYKYWLDFYQFKMKIYLEWYIFKICGQTTILLTFDFDWTKREELDKLFNSKILTA